MKVKLKSILRLALPYILIALLPIVSVVILCGIVVTNHTNEILLNQTGVIEIASGRVEEKIASVEESARVIMEDTDLSSYIFNVRSGTENNIFACQDIQKFLSHVSVNRDISEIYFYDAAEDRIISTDTVLYESDIYFDYLYIYEGRDSADVLSELKTANWRYVYTPAQSITINNIDEQIIEYKISIPITSHSEPCQLVIALDVEALFQDYFDAVTDEAEFHVYYKGEPVFSSFTQFSNMVDVDLPRSLSRIDASDETLYAMEQSFGDGAWRVSFFYPKLAYTDNDNALVRFLVPAVAIPVVLCIFMCIYFTHKNRRQIMDILSLMRGKRTADEDLEGTEYISHELVLSYAGDMAEKFTAYESRLREAHASQKNTVLERLVRNAYRSEAEKNSAVALLELPFGDEKCAAVCVRFDDAGTAYMISHDISARDIIADILQTHVGSQMEVFDNLSNEVVCIISVDDQFCETADNIVSLLNVHIKYRYGLDMHIGIGNPVDDIHNIHQSYEQATEVIRYNERTGRNLSVFGRMDAMDEVMLYPLLTDEKISNYMTLGKADEAKNVIMDIYKEYFNSGDRILSLEAIDFIKYRITNTVLSVAERQGATVPADANKLLSEKNAVQYFSDLTDLVDAIVGQITSKKNNVQNLLAVNVHNYIHEHYSDSSLTIKQIAAQFHFHENYVSNLYKEEYGENLSTAIEKIRIEKASELLGMTDTKISEVAEAVGYSSDSSFRRAFKKITGVSPVDYRSTH